MKWLNYQVLTAVVIMLNVEIWRLLKICAIVNFCQHIGDTQIHTKLLNDRIMNRPSGHLFPGCVSNSKTEHMRSQAGKSVDDRGNCRDVSDVIWKKKHYKRINSKQSANCLAYVWCLHQVYWFSSDQIIWYETFVDIVAALSIRPFVWPSAFLVRDITL
jgi:hypothetical protein